MPQKELRTIALTFASSLEILRSAALEISGKDCAIKPLHVCGRIRVGKSNIAKTIGESSSEIRPASLREAIGGEDPMRGEREAEKAQQDCSIRSAKHRRSRPNLIVRTSRRRTIRFG